MGSGFALLTREAFAAVAPLTRELYRQLLKRMKALGPFEIENKKTSVHFVRESAFAGIHPRKQFLILTIKAAGPIDSQRIVKAEQVSRNRWHLDVKIANAQDADDNVLAWLKRAYALCG